MVFAQRVGSHHDATMTRKSTPSHSMIGRPVLVLLAAAVAVLAAGSVYSARDDNVSDEDAPRYALIAAVLACAALLFFLRGLTLRACALGWATIAVAFALLAWQLAGAPATQYVQVMEVVSALSAVGAALHGA